jgi:haloalkane dehalogenase
LIDIRAETFEGSFNFAPHYHHVNGFEMHFVDEGRGEPIVLIHGDPTWGYLYRTFISILSQRRRCIVPDHMGMGKSGTPRDPYPYRLRHHVANLEALLLHLDLHQMTLVLHDWGGPVGLGFATRHPDRIKRLVLMNTWACAPWPGGPLPRLLELIRSERGEKFVLEKNGYLEPALVGTTHRPENLTKTVLDAYRAPFPTPESRLALLCWSRDIPVQETDPSYPEMKRIEEGLVRFTGTPTLLVWGMRDPVLPESVLRTWQRIYPQATAAEIEDASHFLQEDAPERIVLCIEEFLEANP